MVAALSLGEEPVSHGLLAEVVRAADEDELLAALRESAEAAMVVVDPHVEGYGLRHGLMRDVVAAELMPGERRSLHRRYALAFETISGDGREQAAPDPAVALRRAHHWARADDPERALPAVVHAAQVAEQMHEFGTAHRQWMAALELSAARHAPATLARARAPRALPPADHEASALLRHAADTAHLAGEYDAAVDLLRRLVPDSATVGRTELPSAVRLGRTLLDAGRTGDAVHVLHDAGLAAARMGDDPALSGVHAAHAEALLITGDVRGAQREVERALAVSRRRGEQPEQAPMLATLGFALAYLESPDRGLAAVAEGLMIAERTGDGAAVGRAYQAWADLLSGPLGELHEGVEIARQGVARMRDLGLARSAGVRLLATTANGLFRLGRWSEASDAVDEAWALSPTGADALEVRLARCRLQVGRGEFGAADEDLRAVDLLALDGTGEDPAAEDPAADTVGDPGDGTEPPPLAPRRGTVASRYRVPLLTLRSGVEMWRGRPDLARDLVARGLDVAEHTPDDVFLVAPLVWHGLRAEAEAVAHGMATDRAALDRLARHVAHLERRVPHTLPALRRTVLAYVRMCHAEAGRAAGASDPVAWAQVAQAWSALLHPYPASYALLRRAEALLATGARRGEAARALRTAAETATAMGAAPFLDEIAGLARRARLDVVHAGDAVVTTRDDGPGPASRRAPELVVADLARARGPRRAGRRTVQPPDRPAPLHQRTHRRRPRLPGARQDRHPLPHPGRRPAPARPCPSHRPRSRSPCLMRSTRTTQSARAARRAEPAVGRRGRRAPGRDRGTSRTSSSARAGHATASPASRGLYRTDHVRRPRAATRPATCSAAATSSIELDLAFAQRYLDALARLTGRAARPRRAGGVLFDRRAGRLARSGASRSSASTRT